MLSSQFQDGPRRIQVSWMCGHRKKRGSAAEVTLLSLFCEESIPRLKGTKKNQRDDGLINVGPHVQGSL